MTEGSTQNDPPEGKPVHWEDLEGFVRRLFHDFRNDLNQIQLQLSIVADALPSGDAEAKNAMELLRKGLRSFDDRMKSIRRSLTVPPLQMVPYPLADLVEDLNGKIDKETRGQWSVLAEALGRPEVSQLRVSVDPVLLGELLVLLCRSFGLGEGGGKVTLRCEQSSLFILIPVDAEAMSLALAHPLREAGGDASGLLGFSTQRVVAAMGGELSRPRPETLCLKFPGEPS